MPNPAYGSPWSWGVNEAKMESIREDVRAPWECVHCGNDAWRVPGTDLCESCYAEKLESGCVLCGDAIDPNDADNATRAVGTPKAGRVDCGKCIRLMRKIGTD